MEVRKAVIPAAGLGTRLLPATKSQPKEMLPIVDRPAIQYVVEEAIHAGIEDILIITGRGKRSLEDHFDRSIELESFLIQKEDKETLAAVREISNGPDIFFIRQKEARGLGHAVLCAQKHVEDEPFAVMLGDDIFLSEPPAVAQLIQFCQEHPGAVVAIQEVPLEQVSLYGIVSVTQVNSQVFKIEDLVEKPRPEEAPSNLAVIGRYIFPPNIFAALKETKPDEKGEIQLTDAIKILLESTPVYGFKFTGDRYDIGSKLSYLTTNVELALKRDDLKEEFRQFLKNILQDYKP